MRGNAGVRAELGIRGSVGDAVRGGGCGKTLGLGSSSGVVLVVEGCWIGRASDSPLDSVDASVDAVSPRLSGGALESEFPMARSALVHLAAASVAGATENRRPIWTVALLSVLLSRRCRSAKGAFGIVKKSNASLTFVMELLRVKRRIASLDTRASFTGFGS